MLIWIEDLGRRTHLTGFSKRDTLMRPIVHLIEKDNQWILRALEDDSWRKMEAEGNGCADPVEFIERMMSPNVNPEAEPSVIMTFDIDPNDPNADSFQVWDAK